MRGLRLSDKAALKNLMKYIEWEERPSYQQGNVELQEKKCLEMGAVWNELCDRYPIIFCSER